MLQSWELNPLCHHQGKQNLYWKLFFLFKWYVYRGYVNTIQYVQYFYFQRTTTSVSHLVTGAGIMDQQSKTWVIYNIRKHQNNGVLWLHLEDQTSQISGYTPYNINHWTPYTCNPKESLGKAGPWTSTSLTYYNLLNFAIITCSIIHSNAFHKSSKYFLIDFFGNWTKIYSFLILIGKHWCSASDWLQ